MTIVLPDAPTIAERLTAIMLELAAADVALGVAMRAFEERYIMAVLQCTRGNVSRAAMRMGVHRNTLIRKLGDFPNIPRRRARRFVRRVQPSERDRT